MKKLTPPQLIAGVLADTHLPYRMAVLPNRVLQIFSGVNVILHAGDVDRIALLKPLANLAPLHAVRGNIHLGDLSWGGRDLPREIRLTLANRQVVVTHGHRTGVMGWVLKVPEILQSLWFYHGDRYLNDKIAARLSRRYTQADVVIFGHTHAPYSRIIGSTLFFNPGAVAPTPAKVPSVGLMYFWGDTVTVQIVELTSPSGLRRATSIGRSGQVPPG